MQTAPVAFSTLALRDALNSHGTYTRAWYDLYCYGFNLKGPPRASCLECLDSLGGGGWLEEVDHWGKIYDPRPGLHTASGQSCEQLSSTTRSHHDGLSQHINGQVLCTESSEAKTPTSPSLLSCFRQVCCPTNTESN